MEYKYFISESYDPYQNLALEQCLINAVECDAILYLWQNDNTIVLGRNQDIFTECREEEFKAHGGHIARRRSGGGAVYHDLGNLNFSIICNMPVTERTLYKELVLKAMRAIGINAKFSGRNDIIFNSRKFSGSAAYISGNRVCQHGTILINSDIEKMTYYLTPRAEKLHRHHVDSVMARVINLYEVDSRITVEIVKQSFINAAEATLLDFEANESELKNAIDFFSSKEWIYGGRI